MVWLFIIGQSIVYLSIFTLMSWVIRNILLLFLGDLAAQIVAFLISLFISYKYFTSEKKPSPRDLFSTLLILILVLVAFFFSVLFIALGLQYFINEFVALGLAIVTSIFLAVKAFSWLSKPGLQVGETNHIENPVPDSNIDLPAPPEEN